MKLTCDRTKVASALFILLLLHFGKTELLKHKSRQRGASYRKALYRHYVKLKISLPPKHIQQKVIDNPLTL